MLQFDDSGRYFPFQKIDSKLRKNIIGIIMQIENYRPIANLCSTSNFFEKFILKQTHFLESVNKLDRPPVGNNMALKEIVN